MKWLLVILFMGLMFIKDNLAGQTDGVLSIGKSADIIPHHISLPMKSNNWLAVQGKDEWLGKSENQLHKKLITFDRPEEGIRAAVISLMSRALRKNNNTTVSINQLFFEKDGWATNQEEYRKDLKSKNIPEDSLYDVLDRETLYPLIDFMANHEIGSTDYMMISDEKKNEIINKGIDMAYGYILSPDYKKYNQLIGSE